MSDILERLRHQFDWYDDAAICGEAADEIEHLRDILRTIAKDRVTHVEGPERWVRLYPEDEWRIDAALGISNTPTE
jgi:hypothetical protein